MSRSCECPDPAMEICIDSAESGDIPRLATAFRTWPKPAILFDHYCTEHGAGRIDLLVARDAREIIGYCLVEWESGYPFFRATGIPEIADLSVLPVHRSRGAGRLLLVEAERRIAERSPIAGLRVGLYADYGTAQQMYARHGYVPDGRGVTVDGHPVPPGRR